MIYYAYVVYDLYNLRTEKCEVVCLYYLSFVLLYILIFSAPTIQNKTYIFRFSIISVKKCNMSNTSRCGPVRLDTSHRLDICFGLASRKTGTEVRIFRS
jgi:hypothetical protein